ncbi:hypothetical protein Tamer19_71950 [Cupriavidus sp. TA19]|nr:hypothetical protein Tamer19_71950 [Cupriavidus sp. TA19]
MVGDAKNFDTGSQLSAWLGLVPRQHSSDGKQNLLGTYRAMQKADPEYWVFNVAARRNKNVAAVALARV